jgi:hypothetical protein
MNLKVYQENAKRTVADLGSLKLNLSHMVMGMCTELSELQDAIDNEDKVNIGEELADFQWYLANYNTLRDYTFKSSDLPVYYDDVNDLYYSVSELQDVVKKFIAYDKEINEKSEKSLLSSLQYMIQGFYNTYKLDQGEYLQKNIDKLKERYPGKFTVENAINRDLDAERKILES